MNNAAKNFDTLATSFTERKVFSICDYNYVK